MEHLVTLRMASIATPKNVRRTFGQRVAEKVDTQDEAKQAANGRERAGTKVKQQKKWKEAEKENEEEDEEEEWEEPEDEEDEDEEEREEAEMKKKKEKKGKGTNTRMDKVFKENAKRAEEVQVHRRLAWFSMFATPKGT